MKIKIKRLFAPLFALLPMSAIAAVNATVPDASARKTIRLQYARYRVAMQRQDIPGIMGMLMPDFTWHMPHGKTLDRRQTQDELKSYFHSIKRIESMDVSLQQLTIKGNTAAALVTEKVVALTREAEKEKRTVTTERYREFWLKTGQGWKIQQTRLLTP